MYQLISIRLIDFLLSLSESLDLFSPELSQHQIRTAFIAWQICEKAGLASPDIEHVITASLLHDIGALSPEDKVALHENEYDKNIHIHCMYGEKLLKQSSLFIRASEIVRYHHTAWQDWADDSELPIAQHSQILFIADSVERAIDRTKYILHQSDTIVERISSMEDSDFSPVIVEAFRRVAAHDEFWFDLMSMSLKDMIKDRSPCRNTLIYQDDFLNLSIMLRNIIDFRSHFTATHSTGVSSACALISEIMGFSDVEIEMMKISGNMHDIGKLAVPNSILEKPAKLTKEEFAVIRQHVYYTYSILRNCGLPISIVEWASFHHETLDGKGYPFSLNSKQISLGARIVTVGDVLIALAEDRPYRSGMGKGDVLSVLDKKVKDKHLDPFVVGVVKKHYESVVEPTLLKQQEASIIFINDTEIQNEVRGTGCNKQ